MTHKTIFKTVAILLTCFLFFSCSKDNTNDEKFCALVDEQDFNGTGPIIDNFLTILHHEGRTDEENLNILKDWLEGKSCVRNVSIICNSCIETLPAQSELTMEFISNGQGITMTLDIFMSEPLKFRTFHP